MYSRFKLKNAIKCLLMCFLFLTNMDALYAQTFTTLDDFSDGNYTVNPVWTVSGSGSWSVSGGVLQVGGSSGTYKITTPFTKVCNAWEFRFDLDGSGFTNQIVDYNFFMTSASIDPLTANGYRVRYFIGNTTADNTISLQRVTNGVGSTIVSYSNVSGDQNIRVTRENSLWTLYVGGVSRGTGSNATYTPQSSSYQGALIFIPSTSFTYNHGFDNIRFAEFTPPTLNAQYNGEESKSLCAEATTAYTLSANPTGGANCWMSSANWEYAWYTGTGSDATYWNGSTWTNAENYSSSFVTIANVLPTSTTTYKVKVRCSGDPASGTGQDATGVTVTINPCGTTAGIYQSYAILDLGSGNTYYDLDASTSNTDFNNANLGTFNANQQLTLKGGQNKTYKCGSYDVLNGNINYRIYQNGAIPGAFSSLSLGFLSNDGVSPWNPGCNNQTWETASGSVNLLSGLCDGNYTLEVYNTADYNTGPATPTNTISSNNNGLNYKANFTIDNSSLSGIYESYIIVNSGSGNTFYDLKATTTNADFQGNNFGTFCSTASLVIAGGQNKTFKCPPNDVTNGKLYYRVYPTASPSGSFSEINLGFASNDAGAICSGGQNQTWQSTSTTTNILSGLSSGNYTIEVYSQADYTTNSTCQSTNYANNGSANYKATFSINPNINLSTSPTQVTCNGLNNGAINLTVSGGTPITAVTTATVTQDFNTLASSSTSSTVPTGWAFSETGTNANTTYAAGTGSLGTGDTYSFGASSSSERAFGGLRSGSLVPTIGASFTNTTGKTVTELAISYTGEQWRLGATSREDSLIFEYSTDATSLTNGTWVRYNGLSFKAPVQSGTTGNLDGNNSANRTSISSTITGLNISNATTFWIRWRDFDASGSDDGLAVDDFSITLRAVPSPYNYSWSNGPTTEDISGLAPGSYTVTVTDANSCQAQTTVSITEPTAISGSTSKKSYNGADLSCSTATDGEITVTASGGTGTLQYSKDNGINYQASNTFSGLSAGTYQIKVKDANNCEFSAGSVTIAAPSAIAGSATKKSYKGADLSCSSATDGEITVTASGGTGTLQYSKDNGANYQSSNVFSGLSAGTYQIKVKDGNNCEFSAGDLTITAPPALSLSSSQTNITGCNGDATGSINLTVSGGTTSISSTITQDFNTLANTGTSSALPSGWSFTESGTNANSTYSGGNGSGTNGDTYSFGSTSSSDRAFGGLRSGSLVPTIGASFTNTTGKIVTELAISYTGEQWRLGATGRADRLDFQYSTDASSLSTGTWTDFNALDFTAPITSGSTGALDGNSSANRTAISSIITGLSIANGSTFWIRWNDLDATGADDGLAVDDFSLTLRTEPIPYIYSWSNGASTEDISGLIAGDYTVTVTDTNGCQAQKTVSISQPTAISGTASKKSYNGSDLSCATSTDGAITVTATGGTGTLEYSINGGAYQSSNVFSGLGAGTYTLSVKDANGCTYGPSDVTITAPSAITGSGSVTSSYNGADLSCATSTDGEITVTATGGTGTLEYSINGGAYQSSNVFSGLGAGTYTLSVKDANGCTYGPSDVTITAPAIDPITGPNSVNTDETITLSNASLGGVWTSSDESIATVDANGVVKGISVGTVDIKYTVTNVSTSCVLFSTATILVNLNPTPVTLVSFNATLKDESHALTTWKSVSEINLHHYEVERSVDGIHFEYRGQKLPQGSSTIAASYSFVDELNAQAGIYYYRLKIVNNDGSFSYSSVVVLKLNDPVFAAKFNVYPNPFITDFKIEYNSLSNQKATIVLMSVDGKLIEQRTIEVRKGINTIQMNVSDKLSKGIYLLELKTSDHNFVRRLYKN
ncbi:MAG: T9SS type A sorting domain-containing protein [Ferruginibacter sp.]|nr:T9SS type A sorting domain-containing protein [Ferruginibacter sp.]